MSLQKWFTLQCDFCGRISSPPATTAPAARKVAQDRGGWVRVIAGTTTSSHRPLNADMCEGCTRRTWWYVQTPTVATIRDNGHSTSYGQTSGPHGSESAARESMLAKSTVLHREHMQIFGAKVSEGGRRRIMRAVVKAPRRTAFYIDPDGDQVDLIVDNRTEESTTHEA